jgi:hypothetical protein
MVRLSSAVTEAIVEEYGPAEVLERLSDPFWFQAFGCVVGFDWHSSGLTTVLCGTLKEGLRPKQRYLGLYLAGEKPWLPGKPLRKLKVMPAVTVCL